MVWQAKLPFNSDAEKEILLSKIVLSNLLGVLEGDDELTVYFEEKSALDNFLKLMRDRSVFYREIKEKIDWNAKWQKFHRVIKVKPFIILTPFLKADKKKGDLYKHKIIINPSFAFGTGSHPTTKMCIKYLTTKVKKGDFVLDMGTGSGILAIAAEKLGARAVVAVDIDETALKEAEYKKKQLQKYRTLQ